MIALAVMKFTFHGSLGFVSVFKHRADQFLCSEAILGLVTKLVDVL
jgi:hypothetical protein